MLIQVFFEDLRRDEGIHGLGQLAEIALDDFGLPSVAVALVLIGGVADEIFGEVVDEGEGAVVDGAVDQTHVVGVEDPMHEADRLPLGHQLGCPFHQMVIQLFVRVTLISVDGGKCRFDDVVANGRESLPVFQRSLRMHVPLLQTDFQAAESQKTLAGPHQNGSPLYLYFSVVEGVSFHQIVARH